MWRKLRGSGLHIMNVAGDSNVSPSLSVQKVAKNLEEDSQERAQLYIGFRSYPWRRNNRISGNKIKERRERK